MIEQTNATPDFTVNGSGMYTIHTLVFDPNTLDLSIVVPGVTTGVDVNGLLVQGGGSICASLDVAGAQFMVENPFAGDISYQQFFNCLSYGSTVQLDGVPAGNAMVPAGYQTVYVLTKGSGLVIEQAGAAPSFNVSSNGVYRIHTLVYDPNTLNLAIVVPGVTTGFDVNGLLVQGGGSICASLDVQGAPFLVIPNWICTLFGKDRIDMQYYTQMDPEEAYDVLMENYRETGSLNTANTAEGNISLYPNPAVDRLNIRIDSIDKDNATIEIVNVFGQQVYSGSLSSMSDTGTIDISSMAPGLYILYVKSPGNTLVEKFEKK